MSNHSQASPADNGWVFPLPMWLLALMLLGAELAVCAFWLSATCSEPCGWLSVAIWLVSLMLLSRLFVALASYTLSRVKGVTLKPEQQLSVAAWIKFFLVEYWHLCIQNVLLIPFRVMFHTRSDHGRGPLDGPVVLLQHGYVNNGAVWFFTARALEAQGFRVFTIDQPPFASLDTMGDRLGGRVNEVLAFTGASRLTLVAHSMGGLICRAYLRRHGGAKIERLITMGSPHHGTFHAYLASGPNGAQMRPGNPWLEALGAVETGVPFTSIYSLHDTIISPQDSSVMPGAENVELTAIGHVSMPSGRAARVHLLAALRR